MAPNKKVKPQSRSLDFGGKSPQQAIKYLQNMITHTPEPYKSSLRIESYYDWELSAWRLRLVCYAK